MPIVKFLVAILGYFLGGFLGAISSFLLTRELFENGYESPQRNDSRGTSSSSGKRDSTGTEKEKSQSSQKSSQTQKQNHSDDLFELSLLRLGSLMIKADGKVRKEEVQLVQQHFIKMFGAAKANRLFKRVKDFPTTPESLDEILMNIRRFLTPNNYFAIIQFLYSISLADGELDPSEDDFIFKVGGKLGLSNSQIRQIRNQFIDSENEGNNPDALRKKHLKRLGLGDNPTKEEIKAAFRRLAKEYHPDKLGNVNEAMLKIAEEKFREVKESYDYLMQK